MKKITTIALAAGTFAALFAGNPVQDFKKAQVYLGSYKNPQAAELFDQVAKEAQGDLKTKALLYKAIAMGRTGKFKKEDALAAAAAVPDAKLKAFARMSVLYDRQDFKTLQMEFESEPIEKWPEEYAYLGWRMRGEARRYRNMNDKAIEDLLLAAKNAGADKWTLLHTDRCLFSAYYAKKEYEKAIQAVERVLARKEFSGSWAYQTPVISSVDAYIALKKYAEGHKTLAELDRLKKVSADKGTYGCLFNTSLGKLYAAEGKKAEAKAAFNKALACTKAPKYYLDQAKKAAGSVK